MIISDFFSGVTDDQRFGFLNEWNEKRDHREEEKDQWIPWEISYSLKETSRKNKNGDPVTSKSNAVRMAVQCIVQISCFL